MSDAETSTDDDAFRLIDSELDGRYRVEAYVAHGGFGTVYRGRQPSLDRKVAIKCVRVAADTDPNAEALVLGKLQHSAIVQVFEQGLTTAPSGDRIAYIVMEWLEGLTLAEILDGQAQARDRFSESAAIKLLRPAIEAIAAAHQQIPPIVHRDLKPSNLFVLGEANDVPIKVLDFGAAKIMPSAGAPRAQTTRAPFTPAYAAPEQCSRIGAIGPWTDVFALGLILEEMVLGPDELDVVSDSESASRCGQREDLSAAFKAVCHKATAHVTSDRYQSAQELLVALDRIGRGTASAPSPRRWRAPVVVGGLLLMLSAAFVLKRESAESAEQARVRVPTPSAPGPYTPALAAEQELPRGIPISAQDAGLQAPADAPEPPSPAHESAPQPELVTRAPDKRSVDKPRRAVRAPKLSAEAQVRAERLSAAKKRLTECADVEPDWFRQLCKEREGRSVKERQEEYDFVVSDSHP